MKNIIYLLLIGTLVSIEAPAAEANATTKKATVGVASEQSLFGKRNKRRHNRQRKGFLGGIFRKKSGCGCPKF